MSRPPRSLNRREVRENPSYNWIPKSKKPKSSSSDPLEDELRQIYKLIPSDGPGPKRLNVYCNICGVPFGSIKGDRCDRLLDYVELQKHAESIHLVNRTKENERDDTKMEEDEYDEDSVRATFHELPFHKNCVVPHQSQQTKMEVDDCVQDSVNNGENSGKAELPYTSTVPIPSSDFSVHQLRQLFELVRSPDDMLEDEKHMKRFQVVCKLCRFIADHIQEGSSLHDSHAAHRHASLHRDHFDEDISADQPDYSEAELLRIYLADSYTWDYMRPGAPPRTKPAVVTYFVVCKVCKLLVYATKYDQTSCLHEIPELQEHALMHSEYLCIDGPKAPELDLEDFKRKQFVMGYEGNVSKEDVYTPVQKGFAKICVLCRSEKCSSTYYRLVPMTTCSICQAYHWIWDCPKSEKLRTPYNRSWDL